MAGKNVKNTQKMKTKSTKELTEEVETLKVENDLLRKQVEDLDKIVKILFSKAIAKIDYVNI